ncbi:LysE family translocator [Tsukamurella ocularis]|uniref:LysE family translocator n=1 Tax=Tsukamurella ocularis TaxID=1970234 RepID=UPI0039EEDDCC
MTAAALWAWVGLSALTVATPGADTLLVVRSTMARGPRAGLACVAGIALGCLLWAIAGAAGLTALVAASPQAYDLIRIAGAAYLLWLGGRALWRSFRTSAAQAGIDRPDRPAATLRMGLTSNLFNPKIGVSFISVMPQFLPSGPSRTMWVIVLVLIHLAATLIWLPTVVVLAAHARRAVRTTRLHVWLDRTASTVLVALGTGLAVRIIRS